MPSSKHTTSVEYRSIPGYPGYRIGDDASVWTQRSRNGKGKHGCEWRRLNPYLGAVGYYVVGLRVDGHQYSQLKYVHRLMLEAFVGPCPVGMESCHYDGDRTNNVLSNLRWDTRKANIEDRARHGRMNMPNGSRHFRAKLTEADIPEIRKLSRSGLYPWEIADVFGVTKSTIRVVLKGQAWIHVPG